MWWVVESPSVPGTEPGWAAVPRFGVEFGCPRAPSVEEEPSSLLEAEWAPRLVAGLEGRHPFQLAWSLVEEGRTGGPWKCQPGEMASLLVELPKEPWRSWEPVMNVGHPGHPIDPL
jgi:hypothetical protein